MTTYSNPTIVPSPSKYPCLPCVLRFIAGASLVIFLSLDAAHAAFHFWNINEVYSSADGSVQFVEFSTTTGSQNATGTRVVTCAGPQGSHSFTIPANLSSSLTGNKTFIIGTSNLTVVPGGLTPDFFFTNAVPFLFLNNAGTNTVTLVGAVTTPAAYTNLPTDGDLSLLRTGSGSDFATTATNSPKNFNDQSNTIVPVKFLSAKQAGTNFVMAFRTATGTNGSAGPNYAVEFKDRLTNASWSTLANLGGDGTTKSVSNSLAVATQRFFRLRSP
jgi:hypothetical protein